MVSLPEPRVLPNHIPPAAAISYICCTDVVSLDCSEEFIQLFSDEILHRGTRPSSPLCLLCDPLAVIMFSVCMASVLLWSSCYSDHLQQADAGSQTEYVKTCNVPGDPSLCHPDGWIDGYSLLLLRLQLRFVQPCFFQQNKDVGLKQFRCVSYRKAWKF